MRISNELTLSAVVLDDMIDGVEVKLGMYVNDALGGVMVTRNALQLCELGGE